MYFIIYDFLIFEWILLFPKFRKDILGDKILFSILTETIIQRIIGLQGKEPRFLGWYSFSWL